MSSSYLEIQVDLYSSAANQVLPNSITMPITFDDPASSPYIIAGDEGNPHPGQDALMDAIRTFFQQADYSWYGNDVEYHVFRVIRYSIVPADETPA